VTSPAKGCWLDQVFVVCMGCRKRQDTVPLELSWLARWRASRRPQGLARIPFYASSKAVMRDHAISWTSRKFVPILSRTWPFLCQPLANEPVWGPMPSCTRYHQYPAFRTPLTLVVSRWDQIQVERFHSPGLSVRPCPQPRLPRKTKYGGPSVRGFIDGHHASLYDRTVVGPDERDLTTGAEKPGDIW